MVKLSCQLSDCLFFQTVYNAISMGNLCSSQPQEIAVFRKVNKTPIQGLY
jgi:hypothetical protein